MGMTSCVVDGCVRNHIARGYCTKHYQRWAKFGDPLADHSRRRGTCTIPECGRATEAKGYCGKHYQRFLKHGDPLANFTRTRAECSVSACSRLAVAHGLCNGHYTRKRSGKSLDAPLRRYIITDDLAERLRAYAPPTTPNDCWEWTGSTNKGYGVISVSASKVRAAHVVAWELHHKRSLPEGMLVRHTCDNPPCCNPAHLMLGTHIDNSDDKVSRNRQAKGSKHGIAKLFEEDIREIRFLRGQGLTQSAIARIFGVTQGNIQSILSGKTWAHVK